MRCYRVSAGLITRFAGTNALARQAREELVNRTGRKKKDVTFEQTEIPLAKGELLNFLNGLCDGYERLLSGRADPGPSVASESEPPPPSSGGSVDEGGGAPKSVGGGNGESSVDAEASPARPTKRDKPVGRVGKRKVAKKAKGKKRGR